MSNLLERAIIDAKALKEAALKNAEQLVVEKYQLEVKQAMNKLLEQDDLTGDAGMGDLFGDTGLEDSPVEDLADEEPEEPGIEGGIAADDLEAELPNAFDTDDDQIIQIKLDSLEDDFEDEGEGVFGGDDTLDADEIGIDIQDEDEVEPDLDLGASDSIGIDVDTAGSDLTPAALEEIITSALNDILDEQGEEVELEEGGCGGDEQSPGKRDIKKKKLYEKEQELDEEIDLDELMERVRVEGEPQKSGWAGTPESVMKEYEAMLLAREQDSEVKEENEELRKNVAALQKENKTLTSAATKLQEQNKKFNTAFKALQEKLETLNVSNAKLLYINQALENASLNERQRRKLVEAISKAETVQEAKIVFDTISDAVSTTSDVKKDSTLNEVVSRRSSLLVAARKEQPKKDANPLFNRMQTLAGIKTK